LTFRNPTTTLFEIRGETIMNDAERMNKLLELFGVKAELPGYHKPAKDDGALMLAVAAEGRNAPLARQLWRNIAAVVDLINATALMDGDREATDPTYAFVAADTLRAMAHFYDGVAGGVALANSRGAMPSRSSKEFQAVQSVVKAKIEGEAYHAVKFKMVDPKVTK
jgi:hypothetical protein